MSVNECEIPAGSMLTRDLNGKSTFQDCYRMPLARPELGIADIFAALFGHKPWWVKGLLIARNAAAKLAGLEAPTVAEIMHPIFKADYRVGEKIGPWPIFFLGPDEIVAGRNNKHLDFRVSVLKAVDGEAASVMVSTACAVHNGFGKIYLFLIGPFHRNGVRLLMSNASLAKRL